MARFTKLRSAIADRLGGVRARSRRTGFLPVAAATCVAAYLALVLWPGHPALTSFDPVVAEVERRDLIGTITLDARLERTDTRSVYWNDLQRDSAPRDSRPGAGQGAPMSPSSGRGQTPPAEAPAPPPPASDEMQPAGSSTLTYVAPAGSQLSASDILYAVDGRPTVLMDGTVPAYRDLRRSASDGPDVAQLQQNLVDLGFADQAIVDGHYGASTEAAVAAWQESLGLLRTGEVRSTDMVFAPAPVRVSSTHASAGSSLRPGSRLLDLSIDTLVARADLPVRLMDAFGEGDAAMVQLADGTQVQGAVRSIGTEATRPSGAEVGAATVELIVQFDSTDSDAAIDFAEAEVAIITAVRQNALSVPVSAVVDGGGGRPALILPSSDRTTLVPVELGLVADGYVEVTGGIDEGQQVLLPARTPDLQATMP